MEAIKFERPFHSHLSFSVMCWSQGDYSQGRDVPYSPGPEECLCLSEWHLLWWVIFVPPAPEKKTHSAGRAWRRENTTGCPACDVWESPGCRHCVFGVRSIQKPNTEQYRAIGQLLPIFWSAEMWLCPGNPFTAQQDCHRTEATFTGWDVMVGLFSGSKNEAWEVKPRWKKRKPPAEAACGL